MTIARIEGRCHVTSNCNKYTQNGHLYVESYQYAIRSYQAEYNEISMNNIRYINIRWKIEKKKTLDRIPERYRGNCSLHKEWWGDNHPPDVYNRSS